MSKIKLDFYKNEDRYSDGDIESDLLRYFEEGKNRDLIEDEYFWKYHLTEERKHIVDWYPFEKNSRILEIGSGCGAITEFLCSTGNQITSVDLSLRRSKINAERNKEYENLEIYVGNIEDIQFENKYDYVIVVGVLEYCNKFIAKNGKCGYMAFLELMNTFLKPNGRLLLAIENKYGLKYINGAKEDHLAQYYKGIEGYVDQEVKTFNKNELASMIERSHFTNLNFFYPYPDYKFPDRIFTEKISPSYHNIDNYAKNYDRVRLVNFMERTMITDLSKDGNYGYFANSFLVEATKKMDSASEVAIDNQLPDYICYEKDRMDQINIAHKLKSIKMNTREEIQDIVDSYTLYVTHSNRWDIPELKMENNLLIQGYNQHVNLVDALIEASINEDENTFMMLMKLFYEQLQIHEKNLESKTHIIDVHLEDFVVEEKQMIYTGLNFTLWNSKEYSNEEVFCYIVRKFYEKYKHQLSQKYNYKYVLEKLGLKDHKVKIDILDKKNNSIYPFKSKKAIKTEEFIRQKNELTKKLNRIRKLMQ